LVMETRKLGTLRISVVGLGCMSLVQGDTHAGVDRAQAIATVRAALDAGINCFDNAPGYGAGAAEEVLGEALQGCRDRAVIATKVPAGRLAASELVRSCEESLRRLRTDWIDLLQIHWPNHDIPISETWAAMQDLQRRGVVREIGVCNFGPQDLASVVALGGCASNQVAYSLLMRAAEFAVQPLCRQNGIGLLCYSPLAQGLLTGKYRRADEVPAGRARTRHFHGHRPGVRHGEPGCESLTFAVVERLRALAAELGHTLAEVALAWLVQRPAVTSVLVGASHPDQVPRNVRAVTLPLTGDAVSAAEAATEPVKSALGPTLDLWANPPRTA
jgi:myo-inositol catabolism protein IolS